MTIEEKAKRYDGALYAAKAWHNTFINTKKDKNLKLLLEMIFPELAESEDERIKKTIIRFFKDQYSNETEMYDGSVTVGKVIAWLEKQGEKSPFNKERLMEVAKPETFEEQIEYWQRMCSIAEKIGKDSLTIKELNGLDFIFAPIQSNTGSVISNFFKDNEIEANIRFTSPLSVYLIAFDKRLFIISFTFPLSPFNS